MKNTYSKLFKRSLTSAAIMAILSIGTAYADDVNKGTLRGDIDTTTGQAIANAKISVKNESTGLTRQIITDADGNFIFKALPPGIYNIIVESDGFNSFEQKSFRH